MKEIIYLGCAILICMVIAILSIFGYAWFFAKESIPALSRRINGSRIEDRDLNW